MKLKEREEVWHKIEELARQNPQVFLSVLGLEVLKIKSCILPLPAVIQIHFTQSDSS